MNNLTHKTLTDMCKEYHLIDKNKYNKDLYQKELIYRLTYSIICNYMPKDAIHNSTWLLLHNQDEEHRSWILKLTKELKLNNDENIIGCKINIDLALTKYQENIQMITDNVKYNINNFSLNLLRNNDDNELLINFKNIMYRDNNDEFNEKFNEQIDLFVMNTSKQNAILDAIETFNMVINKFNEDSITFTKNEYFNFYYLYFYNNTFNNKIYDIYYEDELFLLLNE